jgi:hypothetical protein
MRGTTDRTGHSHLPLGIERADRGFMMKTSSEHKVVGGRSAGTVMR